MYCVANENNITFPKPTDITLLHKLEKMSDGEITASAAAAAEVEEEAAAVPNSDDSPLCRQLAVVETVYATPIKTAPFVLPEGWTVKKVPRSDGIREDKYYFEPGTGKKFHSAKAVERHLNGTDYTPLPVAPKQDSCAPKQDSCFEKYYRRRVRRKVIPLIADEKYFPGPEHKSSSKTLKKGSDAKSSRKRKSIVPGGELMKLDNGNLAVTRRTKAAASPFNLPDGWVVKEVPRKNTTKYRGYADKIYFEPGTGRRFFSLISVKRYLAEAEEDKPLAEMFNVGSPAKKPESKKTNSRKKATRPTFGPAIPPPRIKWILTDDDSGGSVFKPSIGGSMVEDHVVQLWVNRFMITINGENRTAPNF